jgi:hypothetical protein
MNKKIILIATFLIWGCKISFGQNYFFTLSDQKIELTDEAYNVTKVTDERSNTSNIGWTQKGLANVKVDASFKKPVEKEVLDFLKSNLNAGGPDIQMIIRTLKISEKTGAFNEKGFCELSVDFILEKDNTTYLVLQSSNKAETKGADVTKKHPNNIATAFQLCFEQLKSVDLTQTNNFLALSKDGVKNQIPDSITYDFPIFKEAIQTGIYTSYADLKNNSPSNTEGFTIEKKIRSREPWKGTYGIIPKFKETNRKVKKVWAIAHEGQVYVYHQREFFPLTIENYTLHFFGYGIPSNQSVAAGAMIGGLMGAGIASGIENSNSKKQKVKYYLDPNTGGFGETILEAEVN